MNRFDRFFFVILTFSFGFYIYKGINSVLFSKPISLKVLNEIKNVTKIDIIDNSHAEIYTLNNKFRYNLGLNKEAFTKFIRDNNENSENEGKDVIDVEYKYNFLNLNFFMNILFIYSIFMVIRSLMSNYNKFSNDLYVSSECKVRLEDVAGLEETKDEVMEFVDILNGSENFKRMRCKVPRGALFYGPPGCGKTLIAKAISNACNANFFNVSGSSFNEVFVGVGQSRVRKLFEVARKNKPSIIFIDEIDTLGKKRSKLSEGYSEQENTLNSLLAEMDGMNENDNILIFGATNRPEVLDPALMRPGRFDRKIQFNLPNKKERENLLKLYLGKYNVRYDCKSDEYINKLADKTFSFSGADISNLCNESAIKAVRTNKEEITQDDINKAFDYIIVGNKRKSSKLSDTERKIVAYHEAGHAIMSYIQKNSESPIKISIIPTTKGALGFSMSGQVDKKLNTKKELLERMAILLGGRLSEEIFFDDITTGASDDLEKLWNLAYTYVCKYGFSDNMKNFNCNEEIASDSIKNDIDNEIKYIINKVENYTSMMLRSYSVTIEKIANKLIEDEEITNVEMDELVGKEYESIITF